jgi:hypothetical protein
LLWKGWWKRKWWSSDPVQDAAEIATARWREMEVRASLLTRKPHFKLGAGTRRSGFVYALGEEGTDFVKIGYSHEPVAASRFYGVQCGNPRQLFMIFETIGTRADERELHKRFAHLHVRNEWFTCDEDMLHFFRTSNDAQIRPRAAPVARNQAVTVITMPNEMVAVAKARANAANRAAKRFPHLFPLSEKAADFVFWLQNQDMIGSHTLEDLFSEYITLMDTMGFQQPISPKKFSARMVEAGCRKWQADCRVNGVGKRPWMLEIPEPKPTSPFDGSVVSNASNSFQGRGEREFGSKSVA